jgi:hypothetical protein
MECDSINEKLQVYLEGILEREELAAVEEHLMRCESCAKNLEELRLTIRLVKGLDEVEPPPWMTHRIMTRVRAEAPPKRGMLDRLFRPLSVKLPIEALAVVLLGVATYYIFKAVEPEVRMVRQAADVPKKEAPQEVQAPPLKDQAPAGTRRFQEPPGPAEDDKAALPDRQLAPATKTFQADSAEREMATESREEPKSREGIRRQESAPTPAPAAPSVLSQEEARVKAAKPEEPAKARQAVATVSVYVQDTERAATQIEGALGQIRGAVIRKEAVPSGVMIHVRLDASRFNDFIARLRSIGRTEEGAAAPIVREGVSEFVIAVLSETEKK